MKMARTRQNIDFQNKESRSSQLFSPEWDLKQEYIKPTLLSRVGFQASGGGQFENLRKGNMLDEEKDKC
jgi:hypothetical protein